MIVMAMGDVDRGEPAIVQLNPIGERRGLTNRGEGIDEDGVPLAEDQLRRLRIPCWRVGIRHTRSRADER